ncbi:hypothetical protein BJ912DRAFT_842680, partial [Pholiota molesta]
EMVHPGAFQGSRKEFLVGEKAAYQAGVDGGYAADALALVQRRYFKRYPIDLPHDQEPEPEALASVDYDAPDIEEEVPDETQLGSEQYAAAMLTVEERRKAVVFRKAQIKRWLEYQHMKDCDMDPKDSGAHNPYRILLHKLTGTTIHCPRRRSAVNVWRKTQRAIIEEEVAKELYARLPSDEKAEWEVRSRDEHAAAIKAWKDETEGSLSTDPEDRQRCIYGLVKFMQPILDLVCEATGWSATLMTGGPEPAHGGRLNVISIHSGTTSGDVKMNFGRAERLRYKNVVVPIYGQFLQKCYSLEECRARALPVMEGFEGMESMDLEADGVDFDTVKINTPTESLSGPPTIPAASSAAAHAASTNPEPNPRNSSSSQPSRAPSRGPSPVAPMPKRTRAPQGASYSASLPISASITTNGAANHPSITEGRRGTRGARHSTALEASSLPPGSGTPPSTRVTRSTHVTARGAPIVPSRVEPVSTPKLEAAPDAPVWFSNALAMLQCDDPNLGDSWNKLIRLWVAFEIKESYGRDLVGKLKAKDRPTVLKDWIQRARSATWRSVISNKDGDWEPLRQPGVNGLLTVVAGLFFWGLGAHADPASRAAWVSFINDCSVVFNGLLATH